MAGDEPMIVVLGPLGGGTSAVASVLRQLGVFMGRGFDASYRELHEIWEDADISQLIRRAISLPTAQLQMEPSLFQEKLRSWADDHRRAARAAGSRPGVKHPLLCVAVDLLPGAWGPIVPVVVDRPFAKVAATLSRLEWFQDQQEREATTRRLIAARDLSLANSPKVTVDFEELRASPLTVVRRLVDELGLDVTEAQVQAAVDSVVKPPDVPKDVDPFQRFIDELLPAVERDPEDLRSVSMLAQVYFDSRDFVNARKWFARMIELSAGAGEETFLAMFRVAQSMEELGVPWHEVQDAYLLAWEFRPTRAEPLYCIARHHFNEKHYRLSYLFAAHAAEIPRPDDDMVLPYPDIYVWRAADAQAKSAFCNDEHLDAFMLWRALLARPDIPDGERQRIAESRDQAVPAMLEAVSQYPDALVRNLIGAQTDADVTVSLIVGPDLVDAQQTLNSFLNCCADVEYVGRFLAIDVGLSATDREMLQALYEFLEFLEPGSGDAPGTQLEQIRGHIQGRLWLHLGQSWRFFAPENLIGRLAGVLDAEPSVFQVAVNLADAATLTGVSAPEDMARRAFGAGRYVMTNSVARGPAMFDTARFDQAAGLGTASLDEVLCIAAP
ncbi:hypothetical protein GCM10009641_23540 [Mycobacterium cookii]|uniref:Uncharacterized protein n=1 Tax=Mycobacterium cookii TaxID=1775 RepID=A0A7I7KTF5_9MYCO|nr:hypothetical protein [Mycobacterium cookii]MCV7330923.1 hypothetical protein [Mycobacterium cookii]BBX45054.1 hypothetical protein MCOO_10690 [Mycobacterium cookii]